jgi:hypothetical protein
MKHLTICSALIAVSGCRNVSGNETPAYLRATATISAAPADSIVRYDGPAEFHRSGPVEGAPTHRVWQIASIGPTYGSVTLTYYGRDDVLRPGVYGIRAPQGGPVAVRSGFEGTYVVATSDVAESFASLDGEVTIATSTSTRIAGTFRFTAWRYCRSVRVEEGAVIDGTCDILRLELTLPRSTIEGSFVATPVVLRTTPL